MSTLILSDLHLGSLSHSDLLRRPELRATLLEAVSEVERVVLLGDVIELRQGPLRDAMAAARPFFEDLGRALDGRELIITAGNHDHALVEPWLAARGEVQEPPALGLEQLFEARDASPALSRIAEWAAPTRVRVAYPGLWVRPDVYATHGHYLDCHLTVPTLERVMVGAMSRLLGRSQESFASVGDYESIGAPLFAWRDAVAREARTGAALNGLGTVNAWHALRSKDDSDISADGHEDGRRASRMRPLRSIRRPRRATARRLRRAALVSAFPLAVAALNRAGVGPLKTNISTGELRRAGLAAMGEVAARLELGDAYVVFGHTHRAGPLAGDDPQEWRGRGGARLINTGSWTYSAIFLSATAGESPYWPGGCVLVEDSGPPIQRCLLADRSHAEISPWYPPASVSQATPDLA
jgi:UDP-2,3-diacylglucosamine pyrophosphatase LpxH